MLARAPGKQVYAAGSEILQRAQTRRSQRGRSHGTGIQEPCGADRVRNSAQMRSSISQVQARVTQKGIKKKGIKKPRVRPAGIFLKTAAAQLALSAL